MKKNLPLITTWLSLTICTVSICAPAALAASTPVAPKNSGQALEIAPPVITLTANPGQMLKLNIRLRDISTSGLIVTNQINDFIAQGEDGTPKILFDDPGNDPYSMKSWINPIPQLSMVTREIKDLPITVTVPKNASPGGHYGVIRFTAAPPDLHGTGVSLSTSLGALMLVRVNGAVTENMSIAEFSVLKDNKNGSLFESTPLQFLVRLKNSGNVHEQPVGQIKVYDMFGKETVDVNVNLPPRNVLPASIRRFTENLDSSELGNKRLFGHYSAKLTVTYGTNKQTTTASLSFWIIPYRLIAAVIFALVAGFFIIRFLVKRYNSRIIKRYNTRRR